MDAQGRLEPPSGDPPPYEARVGDAVVALLPLSQEICRRYREEFPDELARYGDAGNAWCVHDNQHLLSWSAGAVNGWVDMDREVSWLAHVLETRNFPLDRLARNLDLAAEVVSAQVDGRHGPRMASVLRSAATSVRVRSSPEHPR